MALSIEQIKLILSAEDDTKNTFKNVNTGMTGLSSSAGLLTKALAAIGVGLSLDKFMSDLFAVNREFQTLQASLLTAAGDQDTADAIFGKLQTFAKETPFQLDQVVTAFIKLKNLGLTPSMEALTSYGNTAGAMGKNLNDMIEAVADASVGEFERLKEFGIKASSQGDQVAFTFRGITTTVQKNAEDIESYLMKIGEVDFAGGMERQMKTLDGAMSNLGDSWDALLFTIGESGVGDDINVGIGALTESFDLLRRAIHETNEEKLDRLRGELAHTEETLDRAFDGPDLLRWTYGVDGLMDYQGKLIDQIEELEGAVADADDKFASAIGNVETMGDVAALAAAEAKLLTDEENAQAAAVDKAKQKLIDKKEATIVAKQAELELAGVSRDVSRAQAEAAIAAAEHSKQLKDQTVSAEKAAEQATKLTIALEKIASNERIKSMEFAVDFQIEKVKADAAVAEAVIANVGTAIESTGQLMGSLTDNLLDATNFTDKWLMEDLIKNEEKRRDKSFEMQEKLTDSQVALTEARTRALKNGDALITISGDGLAPELEAFMWKILETIQIRAAEDESAFLLGI